MRKGRIGVGRSAGRVGCGILPAWVDARRAPSQPNKGQLRWDAGWCGFVRRSQDKSSLNSTRPRSTAAMRSSLLLQSGGDARLIDRWRRFRVLELLFLLQGRCRLARVVGDGSVQLSRRRGGGVVFECSSSCVVCRGRVRSLVLRHRHEREKGDRDRERV